MTDALIEAAARALFIFDWGETEKEMDELDYADYRKLALRLVPVVTPLIEAAALERAAKVAEEHIHYSTNFGPQPPQSAGDQIAAAIRALKEQPEPRTDCRAGYVRYGACKTCGADATGDCRLHSIGVGVNVP